MIYFEALDDNSCKYPAYSGWKKLINGKLMLEQIPGTHGLMVKEPYVTELAARFLKYLKNV